MSTRSLRSSVKIGASILLLAGAVNSMHYKVDRDHRAIIFDRFHDIKPDVIGEGRHFKIPWLHTPIIFDIRPKLRSDAVTIKTRDLQVVNISLRTLCRPQEDMLPKMYLNFGYDYEKVLLTSIINEVLKAVVAQFNALELITELTLVSQEIKKLLTERANQFGLTLEDISITKLTFGQEFTNAFEETERVSKDENFK